MSLELYVQTEEFVQECFTALRRIYCPEMAGDTFNHDVQHTLAASPIAPPSTPSPHQVPKWEAFLYYAGLRCTKGPKLVYRTSSDKWSMPGGPENYPRLMKHIEVNEDHELGAGGLWDVIRDKVCIPLDVRE